jgi:hypothetical protein
MIEVKLDAALAIVAFGANFIGVVFYQKPCEARHGHFVFQNFGFGRALGWKLHKRAAVATFHVT